jgi:triosephosphate isomerase (TIM)
MRTPLIAGNWKMHTTPTSGAEWMRALLEDLTERDVSRVELVLGVPATHLAVLAPITEGTPVALGAQDVSAHVEGAYTGEVSAAMLADVGATYCIVGHSERREYHFEDDALVRAKVQACRAAGIVPILCVGELEAQRMAGEHEATVIRQLGGALDGVDVERGDDLFIAYEPVWAIGTGKTATADDAQAMGAVVRSFLKGRYGPVADEIRVLYGGSMKPENAAELLAKPDVDGGLIGGASLKRDQYLAIAAAAP